MGAAMRRGPVGLLALLVVGLFGVGAPATVDAQPPPRQPVVIQQPWTLIPSLDVSERFDDNIFLTVHDRKSDFITELTPRLTLEYHSNRFNLSGSYSVVAQYYAETTDLNNFGDNQQGVLTLDYRATPEFLVSVAGYYARTSDTTSPLARPIVPETVIVPPTSQSERRLSQLYGLNASGSYRFDARTTGTVMYSFAAVEQEDTPATYSNSPSLGVSYELTPVDVMSMTASVALYTVSSSAPDQEAYTLTLGWRRQWTPNLTTSLAAGPQLIDEEVHPTVIASSSYQLTRELLASLTYSYGTGLVVGDAGAQQTSSLSGSLSYRPRPELEILVSGSWTKSFPVGASFDEGTDWFFAALTARYQFTKWLSAHLGYQFSLSDSASGESIPDNQLVVGVTFSYPFPF